MMRKKSPMPKRILVLLFVPLIMITFTTIAYGVLLDYVIFNLNLSIAQKPTITANGTILNAPNNLLILKVNGTTRIIEDTDPSLLQISINITNTGKTPINKIVVDNTLPSYWNWIAIYTEPYFTVAYDTATHTITITIADIEAATGKALNQNESIILILNIEYDLKGEPLPAEYETNPPNYTNNATIVGFVGNWQSNRATIITNFTTYIYWI